MNNILIIIQARETSSRLPGKALMSWIDDFTVIQRVHTSCALTGFPTIVAIPNTPPNDKLGRHLGDELIRYFRGDEHNVLKRFVNCWEQCGRPETVVRITADCPFISSDLILIATACHLERGCDYTRFDSIVSGLDVEVYRGEALERTLNEGATDCQKEHVKVNGTKHYITKLSLDTPEDYAYLQRVRAKLEELL